MPGTFCTQCGFENQPTRGACLMCLNYLHRPDGGAVCSSCGANSPKDSRFCRQCGQQLETAAAAIPARAELVARVIDAVGGVGVAAGGGGGSFADEDDFMDDEGFAESIPAAMDTEQFGAEEDSKVSIDDIPAEAVPGPVMEPVTAEPPAPPAEEIEPDEDFSMPPPGVVATLDDEDEDFAPPPPPGVVAPPPPPADSAEEDFSPPPPPPGLVEPPDDGDEFAPPPPPPPPGGFVEPPGEDDFAPPPPPPGLVEPPDDADAPPDGDKKQDEEAETGEQDGEIGGWELDFEE